MLENITVANLERVSEEASVFASTVDFSAGDGKDAWIFDIDETLLSNLPYYIDHGFGVEVFDHSEFDKWVERGVAPAIAPSLKLYQRVIDLGYRVFLLTGRKESHRVVTGTSSFSGILSHKNTFSVVASGYFPFEHPSSEFGCVFFVN